MKKYLLGSLAVLLAVGFSAFAYPKHIEIKSSAYQTAFNWYPVDATTQKTTSATPSFTSQTKPVVVSIQSCKDVTTPVCFIGSNSPVTVGTPASNFPAAQQIKHL